MLPSFLFSLLGGVIADRLQKKPIMITSQLLNTAATLLLAWIIYSGRITFVDFIYFGVFNGTILSISMPARSAVIPEVVGQKYLVNAMALSSATFNLSRILGPSVAGGLIAIFAAGDTTSTRGVGIVFFTIAGLYLLSVGAMSLIRYRGDPVERPRRTMFGDIAEGFRYMRDEKLIFGLLVMGLVPMMFGWAPSFLMPAFNKDIIGGGPQDLGLMMTAMGVGALMGSLALAHLGDVGNKGRVLFVTSYCWAVFVAAFALSQSLAWAMFFGAFMGLFSSLFGSLNMAIVQLAIRPEIRGRVMAIMMMSNGMMPLGLIPISAAAEFAGIDIALLASAVMLALSMVVLGVLFPDLRRIDRGHGPDALRNPGGADALDDAAD